VADVVGLIHGGPPIQLGLGPLVERRHLLQHAARRNGD
jgi:hypothetical protein